jgi:hypothetical protein
MTDAASKIGGRMPDGTVYAGSLNGKPIYTTAADAPGTFTHGKGRTYASSLDAHGHRDWRMPTKTELNMLFNNRAAIGGFDIKGPRHDDLVSLAADWNPAGWYWSSTRGGLVSAWGQHFSDGLTINHFRKHEAHLRCVRG